MKTKLERRDELELLGREPNGLIALRELMCQSTGKHPGSFPDSEVGSTASDYIKQILDAEFPETHSTDPDS